MEYLFGEWFAVLDLEWVVCEMVASLGGKIKFLGGEVKFLGGKIKLWWKPKRRFLDGEIKFVGGKRKDDFSMEK